MTILFERCDLDGSGTISLDEFFMFLLGYVQSQTGVGLDAIFRRYDQKGTDGTLDAAEFQHAAEDLGFGAISHDLFAELDPSGSGTVDGSELLSALKLRGASREAKRFILGLSYEAEHAAVVCSIPARGSSPPRAMKRFGCSWARYSRRTSRPRASRTSSAR